MTDVCSGSERDNQLLKEKEGVVILLAFNIVQRVIFVDANFRMNYPFKLNNIRTAQDSDVEPIVLK